MAGVGISLYGYYYYYKCSSSSSRKAATDHYCGVEALAAPLLFGTVEVPPGAAFKTRERRKLAVVHAPTIGWLGAMQLIGNSSAMLVILVSPTSSRA